MLHTGSRRQRKGRGDRRTAELASSVRNALEETILVDLFPRAQIDLGIQVLQADGSTLAASINAAMLAVADAGELLSCALQQCPVLHGHVATQERHSKLQSGPYLERRLFLCSTASALLRQSCFHAGRRCIAESEHLGQSVMQAGSSRPLTSAGIPMRDMIAATTVGYLESTPLLDTNHTERTGNGPELLLAMHVNQEKAVIMTEEGAMSPEALEGLVALAEQGCKAVGKFMQQSLLEHIQRQAVVRGLSVK